MTDRLAAYVAGLGIGREEVVSVLIPRCEYMTIASIGVSKSGAAYQPLDPSYPKERLAFMMEDSAAKLLIADEELLSLVPQWQGRVLLTKDIPNLPKADKLPEPPKPEDLFILLYTMRAALRRKRRQRFSAHQQIFQMCILCIRSTA